MKKRAIAVATLFLAFSSPVRADVSLGANFGLTTVFPSRGPAHTQLDWPYPNSFWLDGTPAVRPGIRFGFTGGAGHHEGYIDSSFALYMPAGAHVGVFTGNYQYNFAGRANTFFVTGGAGPVIYGNGQDAERVLFMLGGGVGLRQRFSGGYGTFREELRFDFIPASPRFPQVVMLSLKFGFDLWIR